MSGERVERASHTHLGGVHQQPGHAGDQVPTTGLAGVERLVAGSQGCTSRTRGRGGRACVPTTARIAREHVRRRTCCDFIHLIEGRHVSEVSCRDRSMLKTDAHGTCQTHATHAVCENTDCAWQLIPIHGYNIWSHSERCPSPPAIPHPPPPTPKHCVE